ncbi:superoxide dismutase [Actinoplanes sp. NPDC051859]|uniref:superoxide dismutase n=1 Tax=Actinoplanes sp. NPDC051859 TaxID=3363909 RepID=UPI0037B0BA8F
MSGADASSAFHAAQRAAGVIAAKHRGDLDGAHALLAAFPDEQTRTRGFQLLAELALTLVKDATGQSMDELIRELSLHLAAATLPDEPSTGS